MPVGKDEIEQDIVKTQLESMEIEQVMVETQLESIEIEQDINLMETDDETDNNFECEHYSDIEFMDDEQLSDEEEPSLYRRLVNIL